MQGYRPAEIERLDPARKCPGSMACRMCPCCARKTDEHDEATLLPLGIGNLCKAFIRRPE